MDKTQKLVTLVVTAALLALGWYFYKKYTATEQEKQLNRFNRELKAWMTKIKRAMSDPTFWPEHKWYIANPSIREWASSPEQLRATALYQIQIHQPELIPQGYSIADTGSKLELVKN